MGNTQAGAGGGAAGQGSGSSGGRNEPLESYLREQQRDEQLRNLGLKRSKSLRKSISKKLRSKQKSDNANNENCSRNESRTMATTTTTTTTTTTMTTTATRASAESSKPLAKAIPEPLPTHVHQELDGQPKRMERLRRSLRSSLRRKKRDSNQPDAPDGRQPTFRPLSDSQPRTTNRSGSSDSTSKNGRKPQLWLLDETEVRSGTCRFMVKYLGCVEVFESRGMAVCEEAVKVLKNSKRRSVRAIFYVSGDGLRVVDEDTKGLIVDQTIEKVSFCAPDRNYEKGFSYICRDGTTRRWMCHGFMAIKDSGERLSHAVGCAFAICLEKKQERDKVAVTMSFDQNSAAFTRHGSFRQASITQRLFDPQGIKPSQDKPPVENQVDNPWAVQRPKATDLMLQRQTSFRGFNQLQASGNSPFKRQLSLRLSELPSNLERQNTTTTNAAAMTTTTTTTRTVKTTSDDPLSLLQELETLETTETKKQSEEASDLKSRLFQLYRASTTECKVPGLLEPTVVASSTTVVESSDILSVESGEGGERGDPISTMCRELTQELSLLSNEDDSYAGLENKAGPQTSQPSTFLHESFSTPFNALHSLSPTLPTLTENVEDDHDEEEEGKEYKETERRLEVATHNPWDLVPDQPNSNATATTPINTNKAVSCDSSSGVSSNSANVFTDEDQIRQVEAVVEPQSVVSSLWSNNTSSGILDDPFDAEWATLATRNVVNSNSNPFRTSNEASNEPSNHFKAFELRM